jgi:ligand-binding sensor domain-containing protein
MLQDQTGFLWLGDESGLYKYDGHKLTSYRHEPSDPTSIQDNWVTAICEQDSLTLWIGTYRGGISRFDKRTNQFTRFLIDPGNQASLTNHRIFSIFLTMDRTIWVGTPNGIFYRNLSSLNDSLQYGFHLLSLPVMDKGLTLCIYEDRSGLLWFGTFGHGLFSLDRKSRVYRNYQHEPSNPSSISCNIVSTIVEDRKNNLWIGTGNWFSDKGGGLNKYDRQREIFSHFKNDPRDPFSLSNDRVLAIAEIKNSQDTHLWIGAYGGGLDYFDAVAGKFYHFKHNPTDPRTINNNLVQSLLLDRSGVLWIGTKGQGFAKYSSYGSKFRLVSHQPDNHNSLSHDIVMSFCEDKLGNLWIGTYGGGLNKWQRSTNSFEHFHHNPNDFNSLSNDFIMCILTDSEEPDVLWIGTDGGLNKFNIRTMQFQHFLHDPANPNSLSDNGVLCLFQDEQHEFWIGTRVGGLSRMDRKTRHFYHYPVNTNDSLSISDFTIMNITGDRQGNLWVSTFSAGLNMLDRNRKKFIHFKTQAGNEKSLNYNSLANALEDNNGNLWIATNGGGLNCYNPVTKEFKAFTEADGLTSNLIWGIELANDGQLWLSTLNGLCCFNPETYQIRNFTIHDGLQSQMFTPFAHYRNGCGELFFGGINGFNYFNPDSIQYNSQKPVILISSLFIHSPSSHSTTGNKQIYPMNYPLLTSDQETENITLSYQQNFFTFNFTALDFHAPLKNQFAYYLEGFDPSWIYCGNRHEANYTRVDPGRYVFRVKGSNNDGVWNEEGASVRIIITPPFWKTAWFRLLIALAAAGLIYLVYRYRINRLLELERMRIQIASDLHDDIGSTLTKIAVYSEIIQTTTEKKKVKDTSWKIGDMSREIITTLSDVVWSIDARNDTVGDLIDRMRDFLDTAFPPGSIQIDFQTSGLAFQQKINQTLRQNIYLIFKEAVNNAAKHAKASQIRLSLTNGQGDFRMEIADNGVGINATQERSGHHGLANMRLRAARINGDLAIETSPGTRVILTVKAI